MQIFKKLEMTTIITGIEKPGHKMQFKSDKSANQSKTVYKCSTSLRIHENPLIREQRFNISILHTQYLVWPPYIGGITARCGFTKN